MGITQFNPRKIALIKAQEEQEHRMDIAAEMLITERASIYYKDILPDAKYPLLPTSRTLTDWLRDKQYAGRTIPKIITLYKKSHPDHFINSTWLARNLPLYIEFISNALTDPSITNKKRAPEFKNALMNEKWFNDAVVLSSILLIEVCGLRNMKSQTARARMELNKNNRILASKIAPIVGRSTKNHNAYAEQDKLQELISTHIKRSQEYIMNYVKATDEENKLLQEYRGIYNGELSSMQKNMLT